MLTTLLRPPAIDTAHDAPSLSYIIKHDRIKEPISIFVHDQLPEFVTSDYPKFVSFLEAYYEWMEQENNPYGRTQFLMELADVDETLDTYLDYFKSKYLLNFPSTLAVTATGEMVDERTLIKNIRDFYKAKGTEKSYKFLFRILYDSDIELYYPRTDILKISDGRWIENKTLKLTSKNGSVNKYMSSRQIIQRNPVTSNIVAYANVNKVIQYQEGIHDITEVFLDDIVGTFNYGNNAEVEVKVLDGRVLKETVYGIFSSVNITKGGQDYNIGDDVIISQEIYDTSDPTNWRPSFGGRGMIVSVGYRGDITRVEIQDPGVNFTEELNLEFVSTSGRGARGTMIPGALLEYPGYFSDNSGMLSSNKKLQDGYYYQDFSYVIKSEISLRKFKESVKRLVHPAGTKVFGDISIFAAQQSALPTHSEFQGYERPVVGHYTPYAFKTKSNANASPFDGSGGTTETNRYPAGFNPGSTAAFHNWGATGGKLKIYGEGLTGDSFKVSDGVTGSVSGATAQVFEWSVEDTGTAGTLYLMNLSGNFNTTDLISSPQVTGATAGITAGITADLNTNTGIKDGRGIVIEGGITAHDHQGAPLGSAGTEGYTAAATRGMTVWGIHDHPNVRGIYGIGGATGVTAGLTGHGISMSAVELSSFFLMPWNDHFHSSPQQITDWTGGATGPYFGYTGDNNEYSLEYR